MVLINKYSKQVLIFGDNTIMENIFVNLGNVEFIGSVKVLDEIYTLSEFYNLLKYSTTIINNNSNILNWNNATKYNKNNFVSYNGNLYCSLVDNNINFSPASYTNHWKIYGISDESNVTSINNTFGNVNIVDGKGINISKQGNTLVVSVDSTNNTLNIPITATDFTSSLYSYIWSDNKCTIQHNLGGRVFGQLYDNTNKGSLIPINYVNDNIIIIDFPPECKANIVSTNLPWYLILSANVAGTGSTVGGLDFSNIITNKDVNISTTKSLTTTVNEDFNINANNIKLNGNQLNTSGGFVVVQTGNKLPPLDGSLLINLPNSSSTIAINTNCFNGDGSINNPLDIKIGNGLTKTTNLSVDLSNYISTNNIILNHNNTNYLKFDNNGTTLFSLNHINLNTNNLKLNNCDINTPNGLVKLDDNKQIDQTFVKFDQQTNQFINWGKTNTSNLDKLTNIINSYDYFMSYLSNNFEVKETYCIMDLTNNGGNVVIDSSNLDNDNETVYLYQIDGYVLGVESFVTNQDTQTKRFFPDISYDKSIGEYGRTYIYFSQIEYETISNLITPKNKVKIHYVQLKNNN